MPEGTFLQTKPALTKPDSVRVAMPADEPALYALLMKLHDTNFAGLPYAKYLPISEDKIRAHVNTCCHGQGALAGVIYGPENSIIASVGIFCTQPWWSDKFHLSEYWLFVDPDHRTGTSHAADLFQFARWHRADLSARANYEMPLEVTVLTSDRLEAKERLWRRYSTKIGGIFWTDDSNG